MFNLSDPPDHIKARMQPPELPDFEEPEALPVPTEEQEELAPTLQSIANGSLTELDRIIRKPDLDESDPLYQFEKKHKLQAIEVGLRTIGKHEENILRKKQIDVIPIILERIAKEEARLMLENSSQ